MRLLADLSENRPRAVLSGGIFRGAEPSKTAIHEPYYMTERSSGNLTVIATCTISHVQDSCAFGGLSRRVPIEKPFDLSCPRAHSTLSSPMVQSSAFSDPYDSYMVRRYVLFSSSLGAYR